MIPSILFLEHNSLLICCFADARISFEVYILNNFSTKLLCSSISQINTATAVSLI